MAHEIDQTVSAAGSAMYALVPAWHGLGTVLDHLPTSEEAIVTAGLDWTVKLRSLKTEDGIVCDSHMATARMDTKAVLGIVSPDYPIIQNVRAFEAFDVVAKERDLTFESAGSLKGGKLIWALARTPEKLKVSGKDVLETYILMETGHDGKTSLRFLPTTVRVVCWNTLSLARKGKAWISINHVGDIEARIEEAREAMGTADDRFKTTLQVAKRLASFKVKPAVRDELIGDVLDFYFGEASRPEVSGKTDEEVLEVVMSGAEATRKLSSREAKRGMAMDAMMSLWEAQRQKVDGADGSAWALYNAVSEWTDHVYPGQAQKRGSETARAERRFDSVLWGQASDAKNYVFEELGVMAGCSKLLGVEKDN